MIRSDQAVKHTWVALLTLALGCEDNSAAAGGAGPGGSAATGEIFSVRFDDVMVAPGEEGTRCVLKRLGNQSAMHVDSIANELAEGSHHLIVYKTAENEEQTMPFECQPFTGLLNPENGIPLLVSQKSSDSLLLPEGVVIALEPNQMIRLEMHYINSTPDAIEVGATSAFKRMAPELVENEAGFVIFANTAIAIPPRSDWALGPLFLPLPAELAEALFFGFAGHEHKLGTGVKVAIAASREDEATDVTVYEPDEFAWNEPPTVYFDPPLEVPAGGGFRFTCSWQNTTSGQVVFGESAHDEMCLFYSFYYPNKGALACAYTEMLEGGKSFCCPGDPICDLLP